MNRVTTEKWNAKMDRIPFKVQDTADTIQTEPFDLTRPEMRFRGQSVEKHTCVCAICQISHHGLIVV